MTHRMKNYAMSKNLCFPFAELMFEVSMRITLP